MHSGCKTADCKFAQSGQPFTIEHRGRDNMQVIMNRMPGNVPRPAHLPVAGSSAGAYGAATHFTPLREIYPDARRWSSPSGPVACPRLIGR